MARLLPLGRARGRVLVLLRQPTTAPFESIPRLWSATAAELAGLVSRLLSTAGKCHSAGRHTGCGMVEANLPQMPCGHACSSGDLAPGAIGAPWVDTRVEDDCWMKCVARPQSAFKICSKRTKGNRKLNVEVVRAARLRIDGTFRAWRSSKGVSAAPLAKKHT